MDTWFYIFSIIVVVSFAETITSKDDFDWEGMKATLQTKKELWQSFGITKYVYQQSTSCFSMQCWIAAKYILVNNNIAKYVEFDAEKLIESGFDCDADDIVKPIEDNYYDIDYYYDQAIQHAQNGINATCTNDTSNNNDMICGGSITFEYDETLYYPTTISLNYGPYIADAGMSYYFGCLSVYNMDTDTDLSSYVNTCDKFTLPVTPSPTDTNCICTADYDPYCCEGIDYSNLCSAECDGYEVDECSHNECGTCICTEEYDPYCCHGTDYDNLCNAQCDGYESDQCSHNECGNCECTTDEDPYCCDGNEFSNLCNAECNGYLDDACTAGECNTPSPIEIHESSDAFYVFNYLFITIQIAIGVLLL